jgi:hypothetical protein
LYLCNGTKGSECGLFEEGFSPNLTTTLTVYQRRAATVVARSNFSIISVTELGKATMNTEIDLDAYRSALQWLLDFGAAGIPPPTSIVEYFWSAPRQLTSAYWSMELRQAMQSIISFPMWVFNTNNYGNVALGSIVDNSVLPQEYHTTASLARPYTRIVVNEAMFILFVVLEVGSVRS